MKDKLGKNNENKVKVYSPKTQIGKLNIFVESKSIDDSSQAKEAMKLIDNFIIASKKSIENQEQFDECFCLYENAIASIESFENEIKDFEKSSILTKKNEYLLKINENYSAFIKKYNRWTSTEINKLNNTLQKGQIIQFTVSSIALTIFAFLLGNIKAMETPTLKNIVVINLTLLTISLALFAFIGTFLGFLDFSARKRNRAMKVILLLLPIFSLAGVVLTSIFM